MDWLKPPVPPAKYSDPHEQRVVYCILAGVTTMRVAAEQKCIGSRTAIMTPPPQ